MKKIHFVGIGGIGMSGLADISLERGAMITGSDLRPNNLTDKLKSKGAVIFCGHTASNLAGDTTLLVRSACIRDDNPEVKKARDHGIPVILRSEFLKNIIEETEIALGVTGTHGKTTTSSISAHIIDLAGADPTVVLGGETERFRGNSKSGKSKFIVAEVDESDGYFRNISVTHAVVTNVEREHMENYGSMENLVASYGEFIGRVRQGGAFIFNGEDPVLRSLARESGKKTVSFGIDGSFDITGRNIKFTQSIEFELIVYGKKIGDIRSPLIGRYNVMNILGASGACIEAGFSFENIDEAVKSFRGARRRFDTVGSVRGIRVVEDYAHHPTELRSVIRAAKGVAEGRVISVFQPHRYSRTRDLVAEFAECFDESDILILTDIYSADEDIIDGVKGANLFDVVDKSRFDLVEYSKKEDIAKKVGKIAKEGDLVLILGAGDIREIGPEVVRRIKMKDEV